MAGTTSGPIILKPLNLRTVQIEIEGTAELAEMAGVTTKKLRKFLRSDKGGYADKNILGIGGSEIPKK